jgi:hypothetical protein
VELITARNTIDAHLLIGRLTEAGIETKAVPDRSAPGAWLLGGSNPWAPVTVWVQRAQRDAARLVLAEISLDLGDEPRARVSGSGRGGLGSVARWAVALAVVMTLVSLAQVAEAGGPRAGLGARARAGHGSAR